MTALLRPLRVQFIAERGAGVELDALAEGVRARMGAAVTFGRDPLPASDGDAGALAERMARLRVSAPDVRAQEEPMPVEVEHERRVLQGKSPTPRGVPYDGWGFQALLRERLGVAADRVVLVVTPRLLATWDDGDARYHLRAVVLGHPVVISLPGLVEAPAKPREFYLLKQAVGGDPVALAVAKQQLQGRFLEHGDPRLTEVLIGYCLQGVAYAVTGEAFCQAPECRLYNAHWQEEMLRAQLSPPDLCAHHTEVFQRLRAGG